MSSNRKYDSSEVIVGILGLIGGVWGLIYKGAIVVLAIVVIVVFINSCAANATLSEHSSCQQFQQADATTQDKVLQDMLSAHHDQGSLTFIRNDVALYCDLHDPNSPIDGVYGSSMLKKYGE